MDTGLSLFQNYRCDRCCDVIRRCRDGDAGDNANLLIELITPIAMDKELRFAIREGGKTVGAGVVTKIIE